MDKKFIYLLIIFVIVAIAATIKLRSESEIKKENIELISYKMLSETAKLEIRSKKAESLLVHNDKEWVVQNRFSQPADFSKIKNFIKNLKSMDIIDHFKPDNGVLKRQDLLPPEGKENSGVSIKLLDKNNKTIFSMIAGKRRKKGGEFIYLPDKKEIFSIKSYIYTDTEAKEWLKSNLIDIKKDKITKISLVDNKGKNILTLAKNKETLKREIIFPEKIKGTDLKNINFDNNKIDKFFSALQGLELRDIKNKNKQNEYKFKAVFETENGSKIAVNLMNNKGKDNYIALKVIKKANKDKFPVRAKPEQFIYEISKWDFENFITDPKDFLKKTTE